MSGNKLNRTFKKFLFTLGFENACWYKSWPRSLIFNLMKEIIFQQTAPVISGFLLGSLLLFPRHHLSPSQAYIPTATCLCRDFNTHQHHMAMISSETSRQMTDRLISWQADKPDRWYGDDAGAVETESPSAPEVCMADGPPWNARTVPICSQAASLLLLLLLPLHHSGDTNTCWTTN